MWRGERNSIGIAVAASTIVMTGTRNAIQLTEGLLLEIMWSERLFRVQGQGSHEIGVAALVNSLDAGLSSGPAFSPARASLTYTKDMQLRTARLCLDCEEVHESQECPICLSEAGVYLTRWIPPEERRTRRFPSAIKVTPVARDPAGWLTRDPARWVRRGVFGLAVLAASRWLWQTRSEAQSRSTTDAPEDGR